MLRSLASPSLPGQFRPLVSVCNIRLRQPVLGLRKAISFFLPFLFLVASGWAQTDPSAGIIPFSTQVPGVFESVDLSSGNIYTQIPARNKIGKLPFSYALTGNSGVYVITGCTPVGSCGPPTRWGLGGGGGGLSMGVGVGYTQTPIQITCNTTIWSAFEFTNFYLADSTGATHQLIGMPVLYANVPTGCGAHNSSGTGTASDGSGYTLVATQYLYDSDIMEPIFTVYDRSGNAYPTETDPMNLLPPNYTVVQDPDEAKITAVPTYSNNNFLYTTYTDTLDTTALTFEAGGARNYLDAAGNTQQFKGTTSTNTQIQTNFGCPGIAEYPYESSESIANPYILTTPTGNITFTYEITPGDTHSPHYVTGRMAGITYPSGASVSYSYSGGNNNTGIYCPVGDATTGVPTLTKTVTDVNGNQSTWTYVNNNTGTVKGPVIVTDPASNQTVYTFNFEYQTQVASYQGGCPTTITGCSGGGTLLRTTVTCYDGNNASQAACLESYPGRTGNPPTEQDVYTYLGSSATPSLVVTKYNSYGSVTSVSNYGFGATYPPSGTPLSNTTISYNTGSSCGTLNAYISDRPCTVTTYSSGTQVSQTSYTYNSTGHAITTSQWVSSSASPLVSSATYATNGVLTSVTDVNNAVTKYSNGPGVGACNGLLPVGTTYPQIGTVQMSTSQTWDCNGGVVTSTTDANSALTKTYYAVSGVGDPYYRPLQTVDPLLNTTNFTYSPTTFESATNFNGTSSTSDTLVTTDGLGRQIFSQTRQGQGPGTTTFDSTQTTYGWTAGLGAFTKVSVPYSAAAGVSAPSGTAVTTTQYDALSRLLNVTDGGGGTTSYQYAQNDVLQSVGPTQTSQKQFQYNGIGQLASVCEVNALSGNGACGQTNSETGYLTSYTYDSLGNLLTVTQNAQSGAIGGTEKRTYSYDGLSRLTSEQNPETGTVTYTYDTDSTCGTYKGDLVKKVDAVGNVICSATDGLHRQASITHPSGAYASATPDSYFVYDAATVDGATMQNAAGHNAEAYTVAKGAGASGTKLTDEGFSYDADSRVAGVYQSTPNSGGYYATTASYWANNTVNTLSGVPGLSGWTVVPDGEGRPNSATYNSSAPLDFVTGTLYYPTNPTTTVTYGDSDTDVYSFDSTSGRMNQFQFNIKGKTPASLTGVPGWNANWTLGSLGITDGFTSANTQTCSYGYDSLARLNSVSCVNSSNTTVWTQSFTLDPFGNLSKSGSTTFAASYLLSNGTTNNQEQSVASCVPTYDANGNMTKDCTNSDLYAWNADGRPTTLDGKPITYDALGREVEFANAAGTTHTQILYSPIGKLGTMNGQTAVTIRIPLPGGSTAEILGATGGTKRILHSDWLGSARLSTTYTNQTVANDTAYAPYGESYGGSSTDLNLTGQSQDTLSGLYDFLYREYSPVQGRWISPDPSGMGAVDPSNPQSWNRYAYVLNNPLTAIDPNGLWCVWDDGTHDDDPNNDGNATQYDCASQGGHWDPLDIVNGCSDNTGSCTLNDGSTASICGNGICYGSNTATVTAAPPDDVATIGADLSGCIAQGLQATGKELIGYDIINYFAGKADNWAMAHSSYPVISPNAANPFGPSMSGSPPSPTDVAIAAASAHGLEFGADAIHEGAGAQQAIRLGLRNEGVKVSTKFVSKVAGQFGKGLVVLGAFLSGYTFGESVKGCMGP
jgi:RHS repeat-associated protein